MVLLVAVGTYGNSVLNGFAYDDNTIIEGNPVVTEGRVVDALSSSYWPQVVAGAGLYRPVTLSSFTLEWRLWNGHPAGFHLVNVVVHVAVSLLVFLLILEVSATLPALVGAALFAAHPVHSEAVANVVGRAELYSALFVVGACLLFWRDRGLAPFWRAARLLGVGAFYVMGLGSKEMAATLPALLVLLALARNDDERVTDRVRTDLPVFLLTGALLVAFLGVRFLMLGSVTGEVPSPTLVGLSAGQRILTFLAVFPQYFRLLVFPLDLVADYAPAVLFPALTWGPDVILGLLVILGATAAAIYFWPRERLVALGIVWFGIAILPVTNLLIPTGVLLAERTLYLPSVGLAFVVAGAVSWVDREHRTSLGMCLVAAGVLCAGLMVRTALRNPSWSSTFAMLTVIGEEHPESFLAVKARAQGLDLVGEYEEADRYYKTALELAPQGYAVLVEVARFYGGRERWGAAASDPAAARRSAERPVVLGQVRHLPAQPLDLPPQGFDLLGLPPPFRLVLRGQLLQGRRQLPFQRGHTASSLSRQLHGRPIAPGPGRIVQRPGRQHHDALPRRSREASRPGSSPRSPPTSNVPPRLAGSASPKSRSGVRCSWTTSASSPNCRR